MLDKGFQPLLLEVWKSKAHIGRQRVFGYDIPGLIGVWRRHFLMIIFAVLEQVSSTWAILVLSTLLNRTGHGTRTTSGRAKPTRLCNPEYSGHVLFRSKVSVDTGLFAELVYWNCDTLKCYLMSADSVSQTVCWVYGQWNWICVFKVDGFDGTLSHNLRYSSTRNCSVLYWSI